MSTIDRPPVSFGTLRRHLRGVPVIGPGEEGWDAARQAFNTTVDQNPALIATPLDVDDIAAVVRYAADAGATSAVTIAVLDSHGAPVAGVTVSVSADGRG